VIFLQTPTVFWFGGATLSVIHWMFLGLFNDFRKTEVHTAEPIGPQPIVFGLEMVIEKLGRFQPFTGHEGP